MIEQDTIKLLKECDAGIKMGISSIDDVIDYVKSDQLRHDLSVCRNEHVALMNEIDQLLNQYHDDGKEPNMIAKSMSWMKTNVMLIMNESDHVIADLMYDGCNMGVKSLNKYLNQYVAASEKVKDICKKIIKVESQLAIDIRRYL